MTGLFVTGTGTDVGKTFVTANLIRLLRAQGKTVHALKPIISGFNDDAIANSDSAILLGALGRPITGDEIAGISPWRFSAPLSPDMAAAKEGRSLDFDALLSFCRGAITGSDWVLIEGAGGIMSPLDPQHTMLDWMSALRLPVLLVAGSYLGTISHTLSALRVLHQSGLAVTAVAISETAGSTVSLTDTIESIAHFTDRPVIGVSRQADASDPAFARISSLL